MGLTRRERLALAAAVLLAAAAAVDGTYLWRAQRWNAAIASGTPADAEQAAAGEATVDPTVSDRPGAAASTGDAATGSPALPGEPPTGQSTAGEPPASQPAAGQPAPGRSAAGQPAPGRPAGDQAGAPPQVRFAQAYALAAAGQADAALNRYRALQDDPSVGQAARYNGANLLMRQATEVRAGPQPGQAIPLIELAKEAYREVLRRDPQHWDARYNLERAQRLLPDPDASEAPPAEVPRDAERAATTMRGFSPGLP